MLEAQEKRTVLVPAEVCGAGGLAVVVNGVRMTVPANVSTEVPALVADLIAERLAGFYRGRAGQ